MQRWIGLIDCNNFFVSCERLFRPELRGKPVAVLSSNDGCVVARSQEIKDKGIPMGVPYFQIKDIIKDIEATVFSSNFPLYRDVSRRVFEVVRRELECVEQYSVDEAFFLIEGTEVAVLNTASSLKQLIEREVGIPVSIGVASSRTQAKFASVMAKKTTGLVVLSESQWRTHVDTIELHSLWGVGRETAKAYATYGLKTVQDLLLLQERQVLQLFGVTGVRLYMELKGESHWSPSVKRPLQQSILNSRSFKHATFERAVVEDAVAYHVREAAEDLRSMGLKTKMLQVSIRPSRHGDYVLQGGSLSVVFSTPTNDTFVLLDAANQLTKSLFQDGVPYKKAGVLLADFVPDTIMQLGMWEDAAALKTSNLSEAIDSVNKKVGKGSVLIGSRLRTVAWSSSEKLRSPSYTTVWSDIATVKA